LFVLEGIERSSQRDRVLDLLLEQVRLHDVPDARRDPEEHEPHPERAAENEEHHEEDRHAREHVVDRAAELAPVGELDLARGNVRLDRRRHARERAADCLEVRPAALAEASVCRTLVTALWTVDGLVAHGVASKRRQYSTRSEG